MKQVLSFAALLAFLDLPCQGQSMVIPQSCSTTDGPSSSPLAGVTHRSREQILLSSSHLVQMRGRIIDEVWFRRDAAGATTLRSGTADVCLRLSETSVLPEKASRLFGQNHGTQVVTVFSGPISVPASPAVVTDPWAQDQSIRFPLSAGFPYSALNLCLQIDCVSDSGASAAWPVDCARDAASGSASVSGTHCSAVPEISSARMLSVNVESLTVGATASFFASGRFGTPIALMLGAGLPTGIDLTSYGMTGCTLFVQPAVNLTAMLYARPNLSPAWEAGFATFRIALASDPALLAATFTAQAANLETGSQTSNPLGVALSEGLRLSLAPIVPTLGMSTVEGTHVDPPAPLPTEGTVINNRAPVLKLLYH